MKWFKHDSKAHNDEKLREAIHEFGPEAYAVYFITMELVSEKVDHRKDPRISISDRVLREKLRISHQKVTKILSFFDQNSMIFSNFDGKNWEINCPNLLKRLDNWTSNLQVTDKQVSLEVRSKKENEEVRSENQKQIELVNSVENAESSPEPYPKNSDKNENLKNQKLTISDIYKKDLKELKKQKFFAQNSLIESIFTNELCWPKIAEGSAAGHPTAAEIGKLWIKFEDEEDPIDAATKYLAAHQQELTFKPEIKVLKP